MTDGEALLAAIRALPNEDMPRLAYADWLDEDNQPERAEFIRVQCELSRRGEPEYQNFGSLLKGDTADYPNGRCGQCARLRPERCEYHRLYVREQELMNSGATVVLNEGGKTDTFGVVFHRGFVEAFRGSVADWLIHAGAILAVHPVQKVTLTTRPDWQVLNYDIYVGERPIVSSTEWGRQCKVMDPDDVDIALRTWSVERVLRYEWPGVRMWTILRPVRAGDEVVEYFEDVSRNEKGDVIADIGNRSS